MNEHPIRLVVRDDLHRSRLTVLLRALLAIPHYIWFGLWSLLAFLTAVLNWLCALVIGRSPGPLRRFLARYVKYATQLYAYVNLLADPYPNFDGDDGYPIDLTIAAPQRLSRWKVLLRLPLALPAILLGLALSGGGFSWGQRGVNNFFGFDGGGLLRVVSILAWFAILARGSISRGLRDLGAFTLSYAAQLWSYLFLLTDRYPNSDPLAALPEIPLREDPIMLRCEDEERRSRLMVLFRFPLAFPHLLWLYLWGLLALLATIANWLSTLVLGRSPAPLHRFLVAFLRYQVAVYAFLSLIANPFPGFVGAPGSYPVDTVVREPARQGRWTVAFRLPLAVPALIILTVLGWSLWIVAMLGWFASLITAKMPKGLRNLGSLTLRYQAQTYGYLMLLTDAYPYSGPCLPGTPPEAASLDPEPAPEPFSAPPPEPAGMSWPNPSPAGD